MSEGWTSLKLIQWTTGYFEKKGIPNPRLDAELLLAHVLKCQRVDLYTRFERTVSEKDLAKFRELLERRAKREPLQYIIGETEFWGLKIRVTPEVLIPRPETELLVEEALKTSPHEVLDIGTGSGCLAIALAKHLPEAKIVATDVSKEALDLARKNAEANEVADRIEFILADIASIISGGGYADFPPEPPVRVRSRGMNPTLAHGTFDLIVSNPPYIPTDDFPDLQPEVRDFEPRKALDGGTEGLDIIRRILEEAPAFLKTSGSLILEIGSEQAQLVKGLIQRIPSLQLKAIRKDYSSKDRIVNCLKI